ncbi:hypothetical protein D922_00049 [Enterococcus faecalis 06-MB-DW-09]|nr:hypothetical protein D922_00049 [Enterococcus faecalis 06-MB-DW-09]
MPRVTANGKVTDEKEELLELANKMTQDAEANKLESVSVDVTKFDDGAKRISITLDYPANF